MPRSSTNYESRLARLLDALKNPTVAHLLWAEEDSGSGEIRRPVYQIHPSSKSTYTNPDADEQTSARRILEAYGAVVIVPRQPLQSERTYEVTVTYESTSDTWEFHTATLEMTPQGTPAPTTY